MHNGEIIERLRDLIEDRKAFIISDSESDEIYENDIEALEAAVKEILIRVPIKPIVEPYFYGKMYRCTRCKCYNVEPVDSYCPKCGQAIDWNGIADRS